MIPTERELSGTIREELVEVRVDYYAHLVEHAEKTHGWDPEKKVCYCGWTAPETTATRGRS